MYLGPIGNFRIFHAMLWPMGGGLGSGTREIIAGCFGRRELISRRMRYVAMLGGFAVLAIAAFALVLPNLDFIFRTIDQLSLARSDIPLFEAYLAVGYLLLCVGVAALCLPVTVLLVAAGGAILGFSGFLLSLLGITIGSLVPFLIARRLAGRALEEIDARAIRWFRLGFARDDFLFLVLMRVVPWAPFPVTTIMAGALNVETTKFAFATALGFVPSGLALNSIGHGLTRLAELRNLSTLDFLLNRDFLLAVLGVAGLVTLTILRRRFGVV